MSGEAGSALFLSLVMGLSSVGIGIAPAVAVAWLFARRDFPGKALAETLVFLPLVLPPVVTGYLLLFIFGKYSFPGNLLARAGIEIPFTWVGMAIAGTVMGFPLLVRTVRSGFESVDARLEGAARSLGCTRLETFFAVTLPLSWPAVVAGAVLCFARALGEFGATVMMSPGTSGNRTIPLEIFRSYQTPGQEEAVIQLAVVSILLSAVALGASEVLARRFRPRRRDGASRERP
ncbi:MAG: molybdate ABC transporter permease subunit [bacterium]|nr:molybdate ABC transporter permease subunit [bacterium]